ncbi:MAG TPA: O-antigen ligase family protein [Candidatus Dormibacteraeota bacterium]|nr:O-antigen ligase family protein [Candidatus Dormibacteraeota bacterium]
MHPRIPSETARLAHGRRATWFLLLLWLLLWAGYNTGIYVAQATNFPSDLLQFVQGIRAFFPLLAGWLALIVLLKKGGVRVWAVAGPIGLCGLYGAVGLISSALISKFPLNALYWAGMYSAVAIVLIAVCSDEEAFAVLSRLIAANWILDIALLVALLGAIPLLGRLALTPTTGSPLGVVAYNGLVAEHRLIWGMATTRNTGLARYAAVAGLVALGKLWNGKFSRRIAWIPVLLIAVYALVLAQARTETIGFLAGALVILAWRKSRRILLIGGGILGAVLLGLLGFFRLLWEFGSRGGGFDPTLSGRTVQWMEGLAATRRSPWLGLGFQADRYYLHGIQLENAIFQALIQAGVLGTVAFAMALALAWYLLVRLNRCGRSLDLPEEIPGILAFFTVMSVTESTAFYGANWLLLAPVLAYIQVLAWQRGILNFSRRADAAEAPPPKSSRLYARS